VEIVKKNRLKTRRHPLPQAFVLRERGFPAKDKIMIDIFEKLLHDDGS